MPFSFETINKNILLLGLVFLMYRRGNFFNTYIPKPFEIVFVAIVLLTLLYCVKNNKVKAFFQSIPRKILIASILLVVSIIVGWAVTLFGKNVPLNLNMILEMGTFSIGLCTFLLVLFYTRDDDNYSKKFFYALLAPIIFVIVVIFPTIANHFGLAQDGIASGNFLGFFNNTNVVAKILLIPAIYFMALSLFKNTNKWNNIFFIFISGAMVSLVFWTGSRGAILALLLTSFLVWTVFVTNSFQWKKAGRTTLLMILIFSLGFILTPYDRKQILLNRVLNRDTHQLPPKELKQETLSGIVKKSAIISGNSTPKNIAVKKSSDSEPSDSITNEPIETIPETRLQIWPLYANLLIRNPLGFGPYTHMGPNMVKKLDDGVLTQGPHNTYLQIWLWGGLVGLGSFLYILFCGFQNLWNNIRNLLTPNRLAAIAALFAVSVSIIFDDSLSLFHFWVLLALSFRI